MTRRDRITTPGTIHHVVNRGVDRQPIFFGDADRIEFGRLLEEIHHRYGVSVLAYCLMDNHYHLILHVPNGHLSEAMHHLQSVFATHVNARVGRDGPLFKGRFYSALITDDQYLLTATRYVERNALDIVGIDDPCRYRWSSVRARLGFRRPPVWLDCERVMDFFAGRGEYADFLNSSVDLAEPERIHISGLGDLAGLMIALFVDDDVNPAQLDRTLIAALAQSMTTSNRRLIGHALGFDDARSLKRASNRATARLKCSPSLAVALEHLRLELFRTSTSEPSPNAA